MKKITVLVAEDHTIVRRGLVSLLSLCKEIEVVGEAEDGHEAIDQVMSKEPDVVLMDISMPVLNGLEATQRIKKACPEVKILILSAYDNEEYVIHTMRCGANGYLLKNSSPEELYSGIMAVHRGHAFYSPRISKIIQENYVRSGTADGQAGKSQRIPHGLLTPREREILQLIAEGKTHQQIADLLHISIRTVDTHRNNIGQKLDLHDTASLVTYAIKNGIVILSR